MSDVFTRDTTKRAMFGANMVTTAADIRDGLSNTMAMAEGLTGPADDVRGIVWGDQPAGAMLFAGAGQTAEYSDAQQPAARHCLPVPLLVSGYECSEPALQVRDRQ